jgi:hypothetical protein
MFIQVIQATCTRPDEVRALSKVWRDQLASDAQGWLGATYGFTNDHQFIAVVRFESREAAMRNSARPEQTRFAEQMTGLMDGPVEFRDCDDVTVFLDGGSDDAGFVQVIRGKTPDPERTKARLAETDELHRMRPEIIGGTFALEPDGTFTETVAFTDEAAARAGERLEPPAEIRAELEEVFAGATFHDLREPWFDSPRV